MKTGLRLQIINSMIKNNYSHIWDCCCDHGLLGMTILKHQRADTVHFVDIVESITNQVKSQLTTYFNSPKFTNKWQVHCTDVANLPLTDQGIDLQSKKNSHLIIIAGVGGDLLIEFVQTIVKENPTLSLEFILCPVHHNYKVRKSLAALDFNLIDEAIVCENKRFYEVMHVVRNAQLSNSIFEPVTHVGSKMWDFTNRLHQQYLIERLQHYRKMRANPNENVDDIIKAYEALKN